MTLVVSQIALHLRRAVNKGNCNLLANHTKDVGLCRLACFCSRPTSSPSKEKWDILGAVCVQRKPIISKERTEIENKYLSLQTRIEFENSCLSDHELRHIHDKAQAEKLKRGDANETDLDLGTKQTAQDFEDSCQEEIKKFHLASRTTEADSKNDSQSLDRKLDRSLLLLTEQKLGDKKYVWSLPQGVRDEGETMRQTAERVLKETCGSQLKVRFMGNAPCGFYKYKYPKHVREVAGSSTGAKVFFFKAEHLDGQVEKEKEKVKDYKWLVQEELLQHIQKEYYNSVSEFLIDDLPESH